jgi:Peptidase family M28
VLNSGTVVKVSFKDASTLDALQSESVAGKALITEMPDLRGLTPPDRTEAVRLQAEFLNRIATLKPALVLLIDRNNPVGSGGASGRLIDPEARPSPVPANASPVLPIVTVHAPNVVAIFDALPDGAGLLKISVDMPPLVEREVRLRNVAGLLRGSDPLLKETYVMLTAHYDHVGMRAGTGDTIFNGANDDGSGTVSVMEIASALASLNPRPKRSIVFMTVFGEEKGLLGSRYYGRHPLFPIAKTVADVNLEQVGRTDSTEGPQINNASMTGFDFSDLGTIFQKAGEQTGIAVYKHERNSDSYFGRSDNQALADQGVPAHTLCVAFDYPDYHGVGDHADKVDYVNMAKVDRMVALGLVMIANNPEEPKWNEGNPRTARYVTAWKAIHPQ